MGIIRKRFETHWELLDRGRFNLAFTRRMFLRHGVFAAAACASGPLLAMSERRPVGGNEDGELGKTPSPVSDTWQNHAAALNNLSRNAFSGAIGTNFKVIPLDGVLPIWLTLHAVEDLPAIAAVNPASLAVPNKGSGFTPSTSGFVLVFGGSSPLPQGTHLFQHDSLGRFAMFTVPAGNTPGVHSAVVNRLDTPVAAIAYQGLGTQASQPSGVAAKTVMAPAAASSIDEIPSPGLSGNQGARRSVVRD